MSRESCRHAVAWGAFALTLIVTSPAQAGVELTTCGQTLTLGGYLSSDLNCTGYVGNAVTIENGEKLDLRGFTLTGGDGSAIFCPMGCAVTSTAANRGAIRGARDFGIDSENGRLSVSNLVVESNGQGGLRSGYYWGNSGSLLLQDSEISANGGVGAYADSSLLAFRSRVADNVGGGLASDGRTKVQDCEIIGNGVFGISGGHEDEPCCSEKLTVERSVIRRNGVGIQPKGNLRLTGATVAQNSNAGVSHETWYRQPDLLMKGGAIVDNGDAGIVWVRGGKGMIRGALIARNGQDGIDGLDSNMRLTLMDSVVSDNDGAGVEGLFFATLKVTRCRVSGNTGHGLSRNGYQNLPARCLVKLLDSTVINNGVGATCGATETCADVAACVDHMPSIDSGSTCGTSYVLASGFPGNSWGVCAAD